MNLISNDIKHRLPYNYYYFPILILVLAGIGDTLYLTYAHYQNFTDLSWNSFCAISRTVNCDTVSQSPWSIFFDLPIAVWGFCGYMVFLVFLVPLRRQRNSNFEGWTIPVILGFIFSTISITLGYISATRIDAYCILCLLSYIISFSLFFYSWITWRRFGSCSFIQGFIAALKQTGSSLFIKAGLASIFITVILTWLFLPRYWLIEPDAKSTKITTGITSEGHPWIGAKYPEIIIHEFSDYQCFQCYKMHYAIRQIIAENSGKIRLVHRHYPLDHEFNPIASPQPFHIGSGKLALLAIAAANQNKFWDVNDILFQKMRSKEKEIDIESIAEEESLDLEKLKADYQSKSSLALLLKDIRDGLRNDIISTPVFLVNDIMYQGHIPSEVFANLSVD